MLDLDTSAPNAARICVQYGPASELVKSNTRTPARGESQSSRQQVRSSIPPAELVGPAAKDDLLVPWGDPLDIVDRDGN